MSVGHSWRNDVEAPSSVILFDGESTASLTLTMPSAKRKSRLVGSVTPGTEGAGNDRARINGSPADLVDAASPSESLTSRNLKHGDTVLHRAEAGRIPVFRGLGS
jgi:hypothetical protein